MKLKYLDPQPFLEGWSPPPGLAPDPKRLWYEQQASFFDYRSQARKQRYDDETWSIWSNTYEIEHRKSQLGDFGSLARTLGLRSMLSIGSAQASFELVMANQAPDVEIVCSDINIPKGIEKDLSAAPLHGYRKLPYCRLDVSDPDTYSSLPPFDAVFVAATFCVADDDAWLKFIRTSGAKYFLLFHAEEISPFDLLTHPLRVIRNRLRKTVWIGFLRDTKHIVQLFFDSGYRLIALDTPGPKRLRWRKRAYLFARVDITPPNVSIKGIYR